MAFRTYTIEYDPVLRKTTYRFDVYDQDLIRALDGMSPHDRDTIERIVKHPVGVSPALIAMGLTLIIHELNRPVPDEPAEPEFLPPRRLGNGSG